MTASDHEAYRQSVIGNLAFEYRTGMAQMHSQASTQGFLASFSFFDALWVVLAVGTAYKIGAGGESST